MRYFAVLFLIGLFGCASIQPPPGGPEDKTPPSLDTMMPHHRELNVQRDTKLHFIFKNNIDRSAFMSSLSITPYLSGVVKYDWSGYDEVSVTLPEQLRENTTYVVSLGKDLKSKRNAPLLDPIQIVFSTGSIIDTGRISGTMLPPLNPGAPKDLAAISIFAYDITEHSLDTLGFNRTRPDFKTQPDSKGAFEFKAMKSGHAYRIFALIDEFRNNVFDPGIDAFGAANKDAILTSPEEKDMHIRMAPKPVSSKPELQDAEIIDAFHIKARFSEGIDSNSVHSDAFILHDSLGAGISVISAYRDNIEKKPGIVTLLLRTPLKADQVYTLGGDKAFIHDQAGNSLSDSSGSAKFSSSNVRDTFAYPRFEGFSYRDSVRDLDPIFDQLMRFTDAVDTSALMKGLNLVDSNKIDVPLSFKWIDGTKLRIRPKIILSPHAFYHLTFDERSVISPVTSAAVRVKDTTIDLRFFTGDQKDFGTISGEISLADTSLSN
ncbi:MAG: Ig-like domain-containing protein, partial [Ignavibacteriota bacterium]